MEMVLFTRKSSQMDLVRKWWISRMDIDFNSDLLSDFGFMAYEDSGPVAAAFYFPVKGSDVCWAGWPISDPERSKEERSKALNLIFTEIHKVAWVEGYTRVWTISGIPAVQNRLEKLGYIAGDASVTQYYKEL